MRVPGSIPRIDHTASSAARPSAISLPALKKRAEEPRRNAFSTR